MENEEPLKVAFDSLLCSLCCIKPELFNQLLKKVNVTLMRNESFESADSAVDESSGITDDNKGASGSEWFKNVAAENLATLLRKPSYLTTLAMACQSPLAIYQLVDSGLPKLLAHALYEYCCSLSPEVQLLSAPTKNHSQSQSAFTNNDINASVSGFSSSSSTSRNSTCLTDSDKAESYQASNMDTTNNSITIINFEHVPKILDFFSECCSEGLMRDWLGTYQGSIFWKPLLELLCNYRPTDIGEEPLQQAFIRMERSTINFFSRVTSCHPKNEDTLTLLLISVIKKPPTHANANTTTTTTATNSNKSIISGFTRQIVLQLLLENERILVSVRSKQPLQKKDSCSMTLVNHHPSKRINSHHLLFYVSSNTKCQEVLQSCISGW